MLILSNRKFPILIFVCLLFCCVLLFQQTWTPVMRLSCDINEFTGPVSRLAKKLEGFPVVRYISVDGESSSRVHHMKEQLLEAKIDGHLFEGVRCAGYVSCEHIAQFDKTHFLAEGELGCTLSHLLAIRDFYIYTDLPYMVMAEDDFSLDFARYWKHNWTHYFSLLPADWNIIQIAIGHEDTLKQVEIKAMELGSRNSLSPMPIPYQYFVFWGTIAYIVSRKGAKTIMDNILMEDGRFNLLDARFRQRPVADAVLYAYGDTYMWNLLSPMYSPPGNAIHNDGEHAKTYKRVVIDWLTDPI